MALTVKQQLTYWGIAAAILFLLLWFVGDALLPFLIGAAISYCLDPLADRLENLGLTRRLSVLIISMIGLVVFVALILLFIPTLIHQATALLTAIPDAFSSLQSNLSDRFPDMNNEDSVVRRQLLKIGDLIESQGALLLNAVISSAVSFINALVLLIIVPVVAIYLLFDWDNMIAKIDDLLPREHAPTVRRLANEIDKTLASFIRGQGTVCFLLGSYYIVALWLVGLNYGTVVGFIAGFLTFIPFVGAFVGGVLAIGLALFQFWGSTEVIDGETITYGTDWFRIGIVVVIYQLGQIIEGNFLTPRLVGSSIGLHPVWVLLALSVFGSIFGFVGMLVAVPLAAVLGVLTRFAISQYRTSRLYSGEPK